MDKKAIALIFFLLLGSTVAYAAPDRTGRWDAGFSVAAAIPTNDDTSESDDSLGLDTGVQIGGNIAYGVNEWFAVGFSGGWQSHDSDDFSDSISGPDVTGVPLFGELIFRIPTGQESFTPYGVVGLGVVIWDIDDINSSFAGVPFVVETEVDTDFALKLGGGLDWFINDKWIINFEAAYVFSNPEAEATVSSPAFSSFSDSEDIDLDYWTVGGGIKYLFG